MSFKNVEVRKNANVYHDGKVTSRNVQVSTLEDELKKLIK